MSKTLDDKEITRRVVVALDALPVPEEPTGLSTARSSALHDPRTLLAAVLLFVVAATLSSPQFQEAAAQLARYIERIVVGPAWFGYYHDHTARDADGRQVLRLMVTSGDAYGSRTTPDIAGAFANDWWWSPDREHMLVVNGSQLYLGDRAGRIRPIAEAGTGQFVRPLGWVGNDKIWAIVSPTPSDSAAGAERSFVTIDLRSGALERHDLDGLPDGLLGSISPDGRWLSLVTPPTPQGAGPDCGFITAVHDLATRRTIDVVDASGRDALGFGFLSDGRIVVGHCDRAAHTLELSVDAPGAGASVIGVVPLTTRVPVVALGNVGDEILVITSGPEAPQDAYVFDPSGRLLRTLALPRLALAGTIDLATLSSDGKYLGFSVTALVREPLVQYVSRAGVLDLLTGQVVYLCDEGCDWVFLR